jgi:hypothetical protein
MNAMLGALGRDRTGPARVWIAKPAIASQHNRTASLECAVLAIFVDNAWSHRNNRAPRSSPACAASNDAAGYKDMAAMTALAIIKMRVVFDLFFVPSNITPSRPRLLQ